MIAYSINAVLLIGLILLIKRIKAVKELKVWFYPSLILKIGAGIGLGLVYYYHYGYGDTISYHHEAMKMTSLFRQSTSLYLEAMMGKLPNSVEFIYTNQPRAFFLVKILSVFQLMTADSYWLSSMYFSLFSFLGFWLLANTLVAQFPKKKLEIIFSLLLFPSVVFWSSGITKESVAMGAISLLVKCLLDWYFERRMSLSSILLTAILLLLVWHLKYYYLGVFLIVVAPFIIADAYSRAHNSKPRTYLVYGLSCIVLVSLVSLMHYNFHISNILQVIVDNHDLYVLDSRPDQLIEFSALQPNMISIGLNFPFAVWSSLFSIGVWESNQCVEHLAAIENLFLLILAAGAITKLPKLKNRSHHLLITTTIIYIVILSGFLALSTPNLGTLARYRLGYLPFFVLLIVFNNPLLDFLKSKFANNVEEIVE